MLMKSLFEKRPSTHILSFALAISVSSMAMACGGDNGGDDAGGGADSGPTDSACGFADRYLPFEAGHSWTYRVTNLGTPEVVTKNQSLTAENDQELGEVLVQVTEKGNGSTVSKFQIEGDAVMRKKQEDLDATGALEKTTTYNPGQLRIDESSERIALGAEWDETYEVVETDATGFELSRGTTIDHWEVLGVDVDCTSPLGSFKCVHFRRQRTAGGLSDKQYFFAKGIGKVKEVNANQVEELVSCE